MTKKYLMKLAAIFSCAMTMTVFTACTSDDDDNTASPDSPTGQAEYAILFYGYGGDNLDDCILRNMVDFYNGKDESYKKVKIACQYKYSSVEKLQENWLDNLVKDGDVDPATAEQIKLTKEMELQTIRFIVDNTVQDPDVNVMINKENIYGAKNCYVANPDSLTNFINWASNACPAKHYILIISDHGGGYQPHTDLTFEVPAKTRGVVFDKVHQPTTSFSASSLKYAIGRANARMDVVYLDACLMNTIEYQFELKEVTDYYILSTFVVPGAGGSYSVLIDELAKNIDDIETTLKNFNKASVEKWDKDAEAQVAAGIEESKWDYHDMTVTRTKNLDAFGEKFKVFVDKLVAAYADESNKAKVDSITKYAFKVNNSLPGYDLVDYVEDIVNTLSDVYGISDSLFADYGYALTEKGTYVEYEPDSDLRDTEKIPVKEDIYGYFQREVRPYVEDAWISLPQTKIGCEISFNKYFYKPVPLRTLEENERDIRQLDAESQGFIQLLFKNL